MGIMMSKDEDRNSELNRRISADLRARAQSSEREDPDYVEDSNYVKDTKKNRQVHLGLDRFDCLGNHLPDLYYFYLKIF